jgi:hypothetical protein
MPLLNDWKISLDADQVLRAQGADPAVVRSRRPALVQIAEWALSQAMPLLQPSALYAEFPVRELRHERIYLNVPGEDPQSSLLSGPLVSSHLSATEKVAVVACTIGEKVEAAATEIMNKDLLQSLALDAVGSAAAEALGNAVCAYLETQAGQEDLQSTLPLSPGMIDWPVSEGQPQIFHLLEKEGRDFPGFMLRLSPDYVMLPRKSVSFVMGFGASVNKKGRTCDFCTMQETCRYQDHYA